jgi:hypothetical protein
LFGRPLGDHWRTTGWTVGNIPIMPLSASYCIRMCGENNKRPFDITVSDYFEAGLLPNKVISIKTLLSEKLK